MATKEVCYSLVISFIVVMIAKDSQKSDLNHCTSQEPNGEKTRKEVLDLEVGGKPQRTIPEKTHAIR